MPTMTALVAATTDTTTLPALVAERASKAAAAGVEVGGPLVTYPPTPLYPAVLYSAPLLP